jgi:hypothetical protein
LPWKDAGRIVVVASPNPEKNVFKGQVSLADFLDWQVTTKCSSTSRRHGRCYGILLATARGRCTTAFT